MPNPLIIKRISCLGGVGYGAYTLAWYAQVLANGGTATATELAALTVFETAVGADMAEFDRLGIMGMQNEIAARTSFVNPTSTMLTLVNSPTFTAGLGYQGNGTTSYLNTNYNAVTNGVNYTLNDACLGVYSRTSASANTEEIGVRTGTSQTACIDVNFGGVTYSLVNSITFNSSAVGNGSGLFTSSRVDSSNQSLYRNGSLLQNSAVASTSLSNFNFYLLARNTSNVASLFSSRQLSAYFFSSGSINQSNFYTALQNLATTLGFNV